MRCIRILFCGGGGIRTLDTLSDIPVFKTGAFNHSATPPIYWVESEMIITKKPLFAITLDFIFKKDIIKFEILFSQKPNLNYL
jgi:hypothetical protein